MDILQRIRRTFFLSLLTTFLFAAAPSCDVDEDTFSCGGVRECQQDEKCCQSSDGRHYCCDPGSWGCC